MASTTEIVEAQALYRATVGNKADFYISRFLDFDQFGSNRISWNWPAFFFTFPWMLYRRMYGYAVAYLLLVPLILGLVTFTAGLFVDPRVIPIFNAIVFVFALFVFMPMYANAMYHTTVGSRIVKAQASAQSLDHTVQLLEENKGTNLVAAILGVLLLATGLGFMLWQNFMTYQERTVRMQVSEGFLRTGWIQENVAAYHRANDGRWPTMVPEANIPENHGNFVTAITVRDGRIVIEYGKDASDQIAGRALVLSPRVEAFGEIDWVCDDAQLTGVTLLPAKYRPPTCLAGGQVTSPSFDKRTF